MSSAVFIPTYVAVALLILQLLHLQCYEKEQTTTKVSSYHNIPEMVAIDCRDILQDIFTSAKYAENNHVVCDLNNSSGNESTINSGDLELMFSNENSLTGQKGEFESFAMVFLSVNSSVSDVNPEEINALHASFSDDHFGDVLSCFEPINCLILLSLPTFGPNLRTEVQVQIGVEPESKVIEAYVQFRLKDQSIVEDFLIIENSAESKLDPTELYLDSYESDNTKVFGSEDQYWDEDESNDNMDDDDTRNDLNEEVLKFEEALNLTDATVAINKDGTNAFTDHGMYSSDATGTNVDRNEVDAPDTGFDESDTNDAGHDSEPKIKGSQSNTNSDEHDFEISKYNNDFNIDYFSEIPPIRTQTQLLTTSTQRLNQVAIQKGRKFNETTQRHLNRSKLPIYNYAAKSKRKLRSLRNVKIPAPDGKAMSQLRRGIHPLPKKQGHNRKVIQYRHLQRSLLRSGRFNSSSNDAPIVTSLRLGQIRRPLPKNKSLNARSGKNMKNRIMRVLGLHSPANDTPIVSSLRLGQIRRPLPKNKSLKARSGKNSKNRIMRVLGLLSSTANDTQDKSIASLRLGRKIMPRMSLDERKLQASERLDPQIQRAFRLIKEKRGGAGVGGRSARLRSLGIVSSDPNITFSDLRHGHKRTELTKKDKLRMAKKTRDAGTKINQTANDDDDDGNDTDTTTDSPSIGDPDDVFNSHDLDKLNEPDEEIVAQLKKEEEKLPIEYIITTRGVYTGCGVNYTCIGYPPGCQIEHNCIVAVSYQLFENQLYLVLAGENTNYVAVAFSDDDSMGDDVAIVCKRKRGYDRVYIWVGYTTGKGSTKRDFFADEVDTVQRLTSSVYKGIITCDVLLPETLKLEEGLTVEFLVKKYYILFALGVNSLEPRGPGSITYHGFSMSSTKATDLSSKSHETLKLKSHLLVTIHIVLAVITYGFLIPMAIYMSRYGQQAYPYACFRNYPTWIVFHFTSQVMAVLLNTLCVILALIGRSGSTFTSGSSTFHLVIGVLLGLAVIVNAVVGYFIHVKKSVKLELNPKLKWCHYFIGHAIYAFGGLELTRGAYFKKSFVSCSFAVVAGFALLYHFWVHVLLMFNTDYLRRHQEIEEPMFRAFVGPAVRLDIQAPRGDYEVRRGTISFMAYVTTLFTVALLVILFMSNRSCSPLDFDYIHGW